MDYLKHKFGSGYNLHNPHKQEKHRKPWALLNPAVMVKMGYRKLLALSHDDHNHPEHHQKNSSEQDSDSASSTPHVDQYNTLPDSPTRPHSPSNTTITPRRPSGPVTHVWHTISHSARHPSSFLLLGHRDKPRQRQSSISHPLPPTQVAAQASSAAPPALTPGALSYLKQVLIVGCTALGLHLLGLLVLGLLALWLGLVLRLGFTIQNLPGHHSSTAQHHQHSQHHHRHHHRHQHGHQLDHHHVQYNSSDNYNQH